MKATEKIDVLKDKILDIIQDSNLVTSEKLELISLVFELALEGKLADIKANSFIAYKNNND